MDIALLVIDLRKNSCSVVGLDLNCKVAPRLRMRGATIIASCAKL